MYNQYVNQIELKRKANNTENASKPCTEHFQMYKNNSNQIKLFLCAGTSNYI